MYSPPRTLHHDTVSQTIRSTSTSSHSSAVSGHFGHYLAPFVGSSSPLSFALLIDRNIRSASSLQAFNDAALGQMLPTPIATTTTTTVPTTTERADAASYNDEDYLNALSDEDYIDFVANFLKPTLIELVFVLVFFLLMLIGVIGNSLVVFVVSRNQSMWTSMNLFLTNLALSDLLVLVFCLPPTVINDVTKTFWFSESFCKIMLFLQNTSVYVSVLTLMCISIERWKAISSPLAVPFWRTHQVIVVIWLISGCLSIPEPLTLGLYPAEYARKNLTTTWGTRCKESWSAEFQQKYQLTQTIVLFITPLLIISGFCIHMSFILRKKALQIGTRQLRDRQRAIKMLVFVVLIFAISYMPVHLHNIATAFHIEPAEEPNLTIIALRKFIPRFMSYSSSVFNPILYNFMSEKFRKEFRRACCFGSSTTKPQHPHLLSRNSQTSKSMNRTSPNRTSINRNSVNNRSLRSVRYASVSAY
ncbi:7 transmembrane receptor (rhodopsin family) domain-containing protein [Ditylenchus destructor]|uniref:7 transmembrane receptor (Rhodopsin family) domain-containing protein n=1 Tax=Ditylenchus destructor TaxID=166010 RepID=A0AAD4N2Q6_9BILA|nr:7 transmembrane receptor (rhodopsin family) domain-containing protein [Ditylenchus destructor]